jgi:hypothetical protein
MSRSISDGKGNQTSVDNAGTPNLPHVVLDSVYNAQGERTSLAMPRATRLIGSIHRALRLTRRARQTWAMGWGSVVAEGLGVGNEIVQWLTEWGDDYRSGFSPEDLPSNAAGGAFGDDYVTENGSLADAIRQWLSDSCALPRSDPDSGWENLPPTDPSVGGGAGRGSNPSRRPDHMKSFVAPG